jgi:hypothetical protein
MTISLLVIVVLLGVLAALVPMDATVRKLVIAAAVILFVIWVLGITGVLGGGTVIVTH